MSPWLGPLLIALLLLLAGIWETWRAHNRAQEDAPNHPGEM